MIILKKIKKIKLNMVLTREILICLMILIIRVYVCLKQKNIMFIKHWKTSKTSKCLNKFKTLAKSLEIRFPTIPRQSLGESLGSHSAVTQKHKTTSGFIIKNKSLGSHSAVTRQSLGGHSAHVNKT